MNKKVSIIIPTYNRAGHIQRSIDSALDQNYDNIEIIVVDDGSSDDTESVVGKYADSTVDYIRYGNNHGANFARNIGITNSSGEYVSFLDSDDQMHKNYTKKCVLKLNKADEDVAGVITGTSIHNCNGERVNEFGLDRGYIKPADIFDGYRLPGFSTMFFRRSAIENIYPLDTRLPTGQDVDTYIRLARSGFSLLGLDDFMIKYNKNPDQISQDSKRIVTSTSRILGKHKHTLSNKYRSRLNYSLGFHYYNINDMNSCKEHFRTAFEQDRTLKKFLHYFASITGESSLSLLIYLKERSKLYS